ncbi:MAG: hypothetical protein IJ829_00720, partial [Kiritimatiellae bacterium]|nr:hypothetical protein [Kiritimatiellia bacterium]
MNKKALLSVLGPLAAATLATGCATGRYYETATYSTYGGAGYATSGVYYSPTYVETVPAVTYVEPVRPPRVQPRPHRPKHDFYHARGFQPTVREPKKSRPAAQPPKAKPPAA